MEQVVSTANFALLCFQVCALLQMTPLHLAALGGYTDTVEYLVDKGAIIDTDNDGVSYT